MAVRSTTHCDWDGPEHAHRTPQEVAACFAADDAWWAQELARHNGAEAAAISASFRDSDSAHLNTWWAEGL